jgi:hypothetical protein
MICEEIAETVLHRIPPEAIKAIPPRATPLRLSGSRQESFSGSDNDSRRCARVARFGRYAMRTTEATMTDPELALALIEKLMRMFAPALVVAPVLLWLLTRVFYGREK